jgi:hypothetical protein
MNKGMARLLGALAFLAVSSGVGVAEPATLDPAAVAFKLPEQIAWKNNPSGNRTAVLEGDPAKPGPPMRCWCNGCRAI